MRTAVLLLVFNRPDTTKKAFDVLRRIKPPRLYVAADGPRADRDGEAAACAEVRAIATGTDWDCEVRTLFREENLGCGKAISEAIGWFFAHEEQGIILEDDCLITPSWFPFVEELLDRFRDDARVMCISAQHLHLDAHQPAHSYFFSIFNHCWGWATWRRAWTFYDHEMAAWPVLRETDWLLGIGGGNRDFQRHWTRIFQAVSANEIDSWAYRWTFSCWAQNGLSVHPARNLVKNIGFGTDATHTVRNSPLEARMILQEMEFPLDHPSLVMPDFAADNWSTEHVFGVKRKSFVRKCIHAIPLMRGIKTLWRSVLQNRNRD